MKKDLPYILAIFFIVIIFFGRIFFPEPKLFYTPDFGGSDIWNQNYPFKDFLSTSLKGGELPFWSKDIGTGFPMLAEGQVGALYVINLVLFGALPTWLAWNLNYVIHFFLAFLGAYLFFRRLKHSSKASFLAAFVFSFGGFFVVHIPHFNLIQAASLLPWLFLVADRLWNRFSPVNFFLFGVVLSQQVFTGHMQITFISLLGVFVYLVSQRSEASLNQLVENIVYFLAAVLFGFLIAAPQLLPSWEYLNLTFRSGGLSFAQIFQYPYKLKYAITFLSPNFFGTPRDGSYSSPFTSGSGIFWENTGYLGLLPILLILIALFRRKKSANEISFWILALISFLLVLGRSSPLSFIFSFPGFNYFRVPSRFLLLTTFFLSTIAASGFDVLLSKVSKSKIYKKFRIAVFPIALSVAFIDLFVFGYSHHPLVKVERALKLPETVELTEPGKRIYSYPAVGLLWNEVLFSKGWEDIKPYLYFANSLDANLNLIFDRSNVSVHSSILVRRSQVQEQLFPSLFNATAVSYVISPEIIDSEMLDFIGKVAPASEQLPGFFVYSNPQALPRFRFASNHFLAKSPEEFNNVIGMEDFSFEDSVILEKEITGEFEELGTSSFKVMEDKDNRMEIITNTDKRAILVVADGYYPAWRAKVNGKKVEILPANINQRAIIIPEGENTVEMYYDPDKFSRGVVVSLSSVLLVIFWNFMKPTRFMNNIRRFR